MIKITNTGDTPIDVHGVTARAGRTVVVTDRQWAVFKASTAGAYWLAQGVLEVTGDKLKPAAKQPSRAKETTKADISED